MANDDALIILHTNGSLTLDPSVWKQMHDPTVRLGLAALKLTMEGLTNPLPSPAASPKALPPSSDRMVVTLREMLEKSGPLSMRDLCRQAHMARSTLRKYLVEIPDLIRSGPRNNVLYSIVRPIPKTPGVEGEVVAQLEKAGPKGIRLSKLAESIGKPVKRCREIVSKLPVRMETISKHPVVFWEGGGPKVAVLSKTRGVMSRGPFAMNDNDSLLLNGEETEAPVAVRRVARFLIEEGRVSRATLPSRIFSTPSHMRTAIHWLRQHTAQDAILVDGDDYIIPTLGGPC